MNALSIAMYGMFVAIIVPVVKEDFKTLIVVLISILLSVLFYYLPGLKEISVGISISICAVLSAILGAIFFPRREDVEDESKKENLDSEDFVEDVTDLESERASETEEILDEEETKDKRFDGIVVEDLDVTADLTEVIEKVNLDER